MTILHSYALFNLGKESVKTSEFLFFRSLLGIMTLQIFGAAEDIGEVLFGEQGPGKEMILLLGK